MTSDTHNTERFSAHGDELGALPVGAAYHEALAEAVIDRRYVLKREIARGGMGCVFEAQHVVTRARVALKVLRKPALDLADAQERLLREARILGSLRHEMLVAVYDAGVCAKHGPYITLELIDGRVDQHRHSPVATSDSGVMSGRSTHKKRQRLVDRVAERKQVTDLQSDDVLGHHVDRAELGRHRDRGIAEVRLDS